MARIEQIPAMDLAAIEELARMSVRDGLQLLNGRNGLPATWPADGTADALVLELLRLAHLGAMAEAKAPTVAGRSWVRFLVTDAHRAWSNLGALPRE